MSYLDSKNEIIKGLFLPIMSAMNVTIGELQDLFEINFRRWVFPMYAEFFDGSSQNNTTVSQELVFITENQVCYKLRLGNLTFSKSSYISLVFDASNSVYWKRIQTYDFQTGKLTPYHYVQKQPHEPITIDITGKARPGITSHECDNVYFYDYNRVNSQMSLNINPSVQSVSMPYIKGNHICSNDGTAEDCQRKCRNDIIKKLCNCTAVSSQQLSLLDTGCRLGPYEQCLANFTSNEDFLCMSQCLESCTLWQYEVEKYSTSPEYQGVNRTLIITVSSFEYMVRQELPSQSTEDIIGAVGGAVGFWLSLDIITIVFAILTAPIAIFFKIFFKDMDKNAEIIEEVPVASERNLVAETVSLTKRLKEKLKDPLFVKFIAQKFIWTILFIIGAALTMNMFVKQYHQFKEGKTTQSVTVILNKTMTLPESTVCMPIGLAPPSYLIPNFDQEEFNDYMNKSDLSRENFLGTEIKSIMAISIDKYGIYISSNHQYI